MAGGMGGRSMMWAAARREELGGRSVAKGTLPRIWAFASPYRRLLLVFLLLTVVSAVIGVLTPLLAGRVVDTIISAARLPDPVRLVMLLAGVIAGLAVLDAGVGLATRWLSARIGEGLILDLRRSVFGHVQRMPVAFFTRTRTGALVSRLNNDVIGAQSAVTDTLASLVANVIQLVLALAVMIGLAWQVTVLALILLPVFVVPARRMGATIAGLRRESADLNAGMTTRMTERFSAPGATLVKLFGRPRVEADEFGARAGRVRDIGIKNAMATRWFMTSLTLVSALATALANVRVDVMTALVSFERVFEILDLPPMIKEKPDAGTMPAGGVSVSFED